MPSATRFTDINEQANASNPDQPVTSTDAVRRNSAGALAISPVVIEAAFPPLSYPTSAIDQQIALHLRFLGVDVDDRGLQDPVLVRGAGIDREGLAQLHGAASLVDVAVQRQD